MSRKNYTVLIPYPKGGGHYAKSGERLDLLDVQASALRTAGRIELTSVLEAAAVVTTPKAAKAASKDAE